MLNVSSFAISPNPNACQPDQFSLRPHPWLTWERLTMSPVAIVLQAIATAAPTYDESGLSKQDALRDEICDLLDVISSLGIQVPLTLVVQCQETDYGAWHRLAGDQSWIRGTFFLEPFSEAAFRGVGIKDAAQYATLLTDVEATHANKYRLRNISNEDYLEIVRERLTNETNAAIRVFGGYIVEALEGGDVLRAGDRIGQGPISRAVGRWMSEEVLSRASPGSGWALPRDDASSSAGDV